MNYRLSLILVVVALCGCSINAPMSRGAVGDLPGASSNNANSSVDSRCDLLQERARGREERRRTCSGNKDSSKCLLAEGVNIEESIADQDLRNHCVQILNSTVNTPVFPKN